MGWYKDRDFPEIKRPRNGDTPEIFRVTQSKEDIERIIGAHNSEIENLQSQVSGLEFRLFEMTRMRDEWKDQVDFDKSYKNENTVLRDLLQIAMRNIDSDGALVHIRNRLQQLERSDVSSNPPDDQL